MSCGESSNVSNSIDKFVDKIQNSSSNGSLAHLQQLHNRENTFYKEQVEQVRRDFDAKLRIPSSEMEVFEGAFSGAANPQFSLNSLSNHLGRGQEESWTDEFQEFRFDIDAPSNMQILESAWYNGSADDLLESAWDDARYSHGNNDNAVFEDAWNGISSRINPKVTTETTENISAAAHNFLETVPMNEKLANSKFIHWMEKVRNKELVVEGDSLVEKL